jgi:hypothetical protein
MFMIVNKAAQFMFNGSRVLSIWKDVKEANEPMSLLFVKVEELRMIWQRNQQRFRARTCHGVNEAFLFHQFFVSSFSYEGKSLAL